MVLTIFGNGLTNDTYALRALLAGRPVFDLRIEMELTGGASWEDIPPGLYRVRIPSRWPLPTPEGPGRQATFRGDDLPMGSA